MGSFASVIRAQFNDDFNYAPTTASDILDEEIANHLQEIGAGPAIPFRKEKPKVMDVPICLGEPIFINTNQDSLTVSFSTSLSGELFVSYYLENPKNNDQNENNNEEKSELQKYEISYKFPQGLNQKYQFQRPISDFDLSFHFPVEKGASMRKFHFKNKEKGEPSLLEDAIVYDGKIYTISKVFGQDEELQMSEGMCLICYSSTANVLALPCRHCSMCSKCGKRFAALSSNCPICRQKVTELIEIEE